MKQAFLYNASGAAAPWGPTPLLMLLHFLSQQGVGIEHYNIHLKPQAIEDIV